MMDLRPVTAAELDKVGCVKAMNGVAQFYNAKLKAAVIQLRKKLPLAAITYVDVYSAKYSLISQARKNGKEKSILTLNGPLFYTQRARLLS